MSQEAVEAVIGRAVLDEAFGLALFANPEAALVGYALTMDEVRAIKYVDVENLDACAKRLTQHMAGKSRIAAPESIA